MVDRPTVFISYSHKDEGWKDLLHPHLKALVLEGVFELWDDSKIDTGDEWYPEIQAAMARANAAICLISENYLSSDFIIKEEVPYLLTKRRDEGMLLYPVLISPCPWKRISWLKDIQMYPRNGQCIEDIRELVEQKKAFSAVALKVSEKIGQQGRTVALEFAAVASIRMEAELYKAGVRIDIDHLPVTGAELFGRQKELELLDNAWDFDKTNVVSFVAWGGVGKSTLINKWLESMKADNYRGAARVFGWSFYSQGTSEKVTSADLFIKEALKWFGDEKPQEGSPWDKGQRLADLIKKEKTLLILDGLEPLQAEHAFEKGKIQDPALSVLVSELARKNHGLLIITTREEIPELDETGVAAVQKNLEQISPEAGRALLRTAGVVGTDRQLEDVSVAFGNQALALRLLGSYLYEEEGHRIGHTSNIPGLEHIPEDKGRQPRRIMAAFETRFGEGPEVEFLRILGLFDRPAEQGAIEALLGGKTISHLTKQLRKLGKAGQNNLIAKLRDLNLIASASRHDIGRFDSHPLVREHFGEQLKSIYPAAWREGNSRLYEYYKTQTPELPETIEEMAPLFFAVAHGCAAGRHQEAYNNIYNKKIRRGNEYFSTKKLAAFGSDLACLSHFFETPWRVPVTYLTASNKAVLLNNAGAFLRALGRIAEVAEPMQAALAVHIQQANWKECSRDAGNLNELLLTIGRVGQAVEYAGRSVGYADMSGDAFMKIYSLTTNADALHQTGCIVEALMLFRDAEEMQKKHQPQYPVLYSYQGFRYCDLLLSKGDFQEVLKRAGQTLKWALQNNLSLLSIAFDNLSLSRAHMFKALKAGRDYSEAEIYLNAAVEGMRKASAQEFIARGLLARAELYRHKKECSKARHDLNEAMTISTRGGMGLHKADCHLEYARLYLAEGDKEKAKEHLSTARKMTDEMGYHRRDVEVWLIDARITLADSDKTTALAHLANAKRIIDEKGLHGWDWEVKEIEEFLA